VSEAVAEDQSEKRKVGMEIISFIVIIYLCIMMLLILEYFESKGEKFL